MVRFRLTLPRTYKPWIGNSLHKLYRVTLNSRKTRDLFEIHHLAIVQTRPSSPILDFVDKFVCTTTSKARVFFWVIITRGLGRLN